MRVRFLRVETQRRVLPVTSVGAALIITLYLGQAIAAENYGLLMILLTLGSAAFLGLFILRNWRIGVFAFFTWIVFEDLVRKYLGNNLVIYAVKDVVVLMTYISYFLGLRKQGREGFKNPLAVPLLLWFGWAVVEAFNPHVEHFLVPIVGLRMSFLYVPMLWLGYAFARDEPGLKRFLVLSLSLGGIAAVLGMVQAVVGLDFLNPEAPGLRTELIRQAPGVGLEVPRPVGTFADAGRFAQYLFVLIYVGLGLVSYLSAERQGRRRGLWFWIWLCWGAIIAALFISGQRAAILWVILSALILGTLFIQGKRGQARLPIMRIAVGASAALALLSLLSVERVYAVYRFFVDTLSPTSPYSELFQRQYGWTGVIYSLQSSLLGHGTGSNSLGQQYILEPERQLAAVEGGYSAVAWEWGLVGLVLWLWWSVVLMRESYRRVMLLRGTPFYWLGVSIGLYAFFILFPWFYVGMQVYQNYITQAFLWLLLGVLLRLPHLAAKEYPVRVLAR